MLHKSTEIEVDGIIYDLEDSVSPSEKAFARNNVIEKIKTIREEEIKTEIIVRINSFSTPYAFDDLVGVCQYSPDAVIITKATSERIIAADYILLMLEMKYGLVDKTIKIIPLIETPQGIEEISRIITSSNRIVAAQFGAEDFTTEMGIARRSDNIEISYCRNRMAIACKACRIDCIDTPYTDYKDIEGCEIDTMYAKSIGMTGKAIIHPCLIEITREVFSHSEREIAEAKGILSAYELALKVGSGAASLNNKMIDAPIAERARKIIEKSTNICE